MCGISGIISNSYSKPELIQECNLMKDKITHRGPDDSGIWVENESGVAMAHNRLSIIDLSKSGHQPMKSISGRYIISFNGEIYNYLEIKEILNKDYTDKSIWKSSSDTEVLINAIDILGLTNTLKLIKGMFAFALWDKINEEMILVRDRFGEKPLYWGFIKNSKNNQRDIVFASDLKAFMGNKNFDNILSKDGLNNYFNYGYISAPNSIYENIFQLLPGHLIKIDKKKFKDNPLYKPTSKSWYKFLKKDKKQIINLKENNISENLEDLLIKSINNKYNADVPVCTFLSGGIDSSLVAALLQKDKIERINTMTISFPDYKESDQSFDEGPFASKIANYLGSNHTNVAITSKEALNIIPSISKIYSEPFSDSSQIPTYLLCKATKYSGYKVALTGDGADELFGGYNRHIYLPRIYSLLNKTPKEIKKFLNSIISNIPISNKGLLMDKKQKLINVIYKSNTIENCYESLLNLWNNKEECVLKNEVYRDLLKDLTLPNANTISERIMLRDLIEYLPSDILVKTDRASMANSIETRAPFLDHEIAEYSRYIPLNMKSYSSKFSRSGKIILKDILKKYIPQELYRRPKAGFAVPIGLWLKGPLKEWARDLLSESKIKEQGYLDFNKVENIWNRHIENKYDYTPQLWCILMWQAWLKNH